jgi:hypothetical protein
MARFTQWPRHLEPAFGSKPSCIPSRRRVAFGRSGDGQQRRALWHDLERRRVEPRDGVRDQTDGDADPEPFTDVLDEPDAHTFDGSDPDADPHRDAHSHADADRDRHSNRDADDEPRPADLVTAVTDDSRDLRQREGAKPKSKEVKLKNEKKTAGGASITITSAAVPAGLFSATSNCNGAILLPGKDCKVTVTFTPPSSAGTFLDTLTVTSDAANGPMQQVPLIGIGKSVN